MKLKDAEILMRYPPPPGFGVTILRKGDRTAVSYNFPGNGKLRISLRPDSLDISGWVSSLGGHYLYSTGSIRVDDATIAALASGTMPGRSDADATGVLTGYTKLRQMDENEDTDS